MTTEKQIAANRRNAKKSTGPKTEQGKTHSCQNAFRHGLTAETVIAVLETAEDYAQFEEAVVANFDPRTTVEHQLVARLASLLWRLRRALAIESGLFQIQGRMLRARRSEKRRRAGDPLKVFKKLLVQPHKGADTSGMNDPESIAAISARPSSVDPSLCFLRIANLNGDVIERIGRYETRLWRQLVQTLVILNSFYPLGMQIGRKGGPD